MTVLREEHAAPMLRAPVLPHRAAVLLRRRPSPYEQVWLGVTLLLALAAAGRAALWFAVMTWLVARALSGPRRTQLSYLPAGAVLSSCGVLLALLAADYLRLTPLDETWSARVVLLAVSLASTPLLIARRDSSGRLADGAELIVCAPAAGVLALGLGLSTRSLSGAVGPFLHGWDNGAHLLYAAAIQQTGTLSYATNAYPRGVHALVAVIVGSRLDPTRTPQLLEAYLRTQSLTVWVMYALLTAAVGLATLRLGRLRALSPKLAVIAGAAAAVATLTPGFFSFTMLYGFETTIALGLLLAVTTLELLDPPYTPQTCVLLACVVMGAGQAWTLGIPVAGLPLLVIGLGMARQLLTTARPALFAAALLCAAALPPSLAVSERTGVAGVAVPGAINDLPALWFWGGLTATAWLAVDRRRAAPGRLVALLVMATVGVAVGVARLSGASLNDYYPRKLLWHAALLGLPAFAVMVTSAYAGALRRLADVPVLRLSGPPLGVLGLAVLGAFAIGGPYMSASGGWSLTGAPEQIVVHTPDRQAVCALDSAFARRMTVRILHFYDDRPALAPDGGLPRCSRRPTAR